MLRLESQQYASAPFQTHCGDAGSKHNLNGLARPRKLGRASSFTKAEIEAKIATETNVPDEFFKEWADCTQRLVKLLSDNKVSKKRAQRFRFYTHQLIKLSRT